jgi:hypothetical protein
VHLCSAKRPSPLGRFGPRPKKQGRRGEAAAPVDSVEPEAWGPWGRGEEHHQSGGTQIRGVGKVGAYREWSSTVTQLSGGESMTIGRRGGGGHRLGGRGVAVSSSGGRGGEGIPGEWSEWPVHAAALDSGRR